MTIAPGALVTVKQTGTVLWVVVGRADDGIRWRLRSKRIDQNGRHDVTARIAGSGDITVVREAPAYAPNTMIEHEGRLHEVVADHGDSVELITPASRHSLKGGHALQTKDSVDPLRGTILTRAWPLKPKVPPVASGRKLEQHRSRVH
jgi:hypothetical protein